MYKLIGSLFFICTTNLFALSPFSLEGINSVNLKVIDKSKLTHKENLAKIKNEIQQSLESIGIQTTSDNFSNFIVQIQGSKIEQIFVMHISIFIVEDSIPVRNKTIEQMSITYYKDDFFDSNEQEIQKDIYESIMKYLLSDLLEQYKEENK